MKTPFALISDLHANLEAAKAVFEDIDRQGVREVICLGDIVGYGPDPGAVLDLVMERATAVVAGNHDWALVHGFDHLFSVHAREAIQYTRRILKPGPLDLFGRNRARWRYLLDLPKRLEFDTLQFVHGTVRDPIWEYCFGNRHRHWDPEQLDDLFPHIQWICFAGHTHFPVVIRNDKVCWYPSDEEPILHLESRHKYIVNVGSVGQPRDLDPRACYAVFDGTAVSYRRVTYDAERTCRKIRATNGIENVMGERLLIGR